ncbi:MAG: type II toxin-antitoxin system VapC family toxin [Myxococcota bacterium]|jgi:predicted nucleic acid-binding protein
MKMFMDSSAFAKRYVEEPGSADVDSICQSASELAVSIICLPEILSALNRRLREKHLSHQQYLVAKSRLIADMRDVLMINLTGEVIQKTTHLLEIAPLRAMDAIHVACAVEWGAQLFVSSDARQTGAAGHAGLPVRLV